MNTLQDTLGTLDAPVRELVEMIMKTSRSIFDDGRSLAPFMFFMPPGSETPEIVEVPDLTDENKPHVWDTLRKARRQCKTVAFISEVWESRPKPGDGIWEGGECKVMPINDPNRTESVMLQLWEGSRTITFKSQITRNPDNMGPWVTFWDSKFPRKGFLDKVEGAMMDGEPCSLEGN